MKKPSPKPDPAKIGSKISLEKVDNLFRNESTKGSQEKTRSG